MTLAQQDVAIMCLWLLVTWLIVSVSRRFSKRLFPAQPTTSHVLVTAVLSVAVINLSLLAVGTIGYFSRFPALLAAIVACGVLWLSCESLDQQMVDAETQETESGRSPRSVAIVIWYIAIFAYTGHLVINGLLSFPTDWDTLMYHLPFIDFWIQSESLTSTQSARWSTPATGELIGSWFALPVSGDFLVALTNMPIMVLFASGVIELSKRLGLLGIWPHLVAISCLATHVTFRQSVDVSNDIAVAAFFMAGLAFALRYHNDGRLANACLFGICFGLLCGVKYFALGYAAVLGGLGVLLLAAWAIGGNAIDPRHLSAQQTSRRWRNLPFHCACAASLAVVSGGYWYARNWWMTGYALYPKGSPEMSERILYEDLSKTTLIGNGDPLVSDLLADAVWRLGGPLHIIAVGAIPALELLTIVAVVSRLLRRGSKHPISPFNTQDIGRAVMAIGVIGCCGVWLITPMLVEDQPGTLNHLRWGYAPIRYGMTFLSMAVLCLFMMIELVSRTLTDRLRFLLNWAVGGVILVQIALLVMRVVRFDLITASMLGANLGLAALWLRLLSRQFPLLGFIRLPAAIFSVSVGVYFLSIRWHDGFASHFDRYDRTTAYSVMQDETHRIIALSNRVYPFIGSRRQNKVVQPMLFYGVDAVAELSLAVDADLVATRVDNHKTLARYRPSWDALEADPRFESLPLNSGALKLFRLGDLDTTEAKEQN